MGNRGTTRSWDEEEIARYGILGHYANVVRGIKIRESAARQERNEGFKKLLSLLRRHTTLQWHKETLRTATELCTTLKHTTHLGGPCAQCLAASQTALEWLYKDDS